MIKETVDQLSKDFKNILNQQIFAPFENIFSKQLTGFHQGFNVQQSFSYA